MREEENIQSSLRAALAESGVAPVLRTYRPGSALFRQGYTADELLFITGGLARTQLLAENGQEVLVCLVGPAQILGDLEYFHPSEAVCSVVAVEEVSAECVRHERIAAAARTRPGLDYLMGRSLASRLVENARRFEEMYCYPLEYNVLVAALSRLGLSDRPLRKEELQVYLGVSARHLNRVLAGLAAEGLVAASGGTLEVLDAERGRRALARMRRS